MKSKPRRLLEVPGTRSTRLPLSPPAGRHGASGASYRSSSWSAWIPIRSCRRAGPVDRSRGAIHRRPKSKRAMSTCQARPIGSTVSCSSRSPFRTASTTIKSTRSEEGDHTADVVRLSETLQGLHAERVVPAGIRLGEVRHVCLDNSWRDGVYAEAAAAEHEGEVLHQRVDGALSRCIGR
jgi:hypothetical protein